MAIQNGNNIKFAKALTKDIFEKNTSTAKPTDTLVFIDDTKEIFLDNTYYGNNHLIDVTYEQLKNLRDTSKLIPGQFYRLTDYKCTTSLENTSARNYSFYIIIHAISKNELSEECKAEFNPNNAGYFESCNLLKWKIWYTIDLEPKYYWIKDVPKSTYRGVIYRMIDDFENDCPYDFKNIEFKRNGIISKQANMLSSPNAEYFYGKRFCNDLMDLIDNTSTVAYNFPTFTYITGSANIYELTSILAYNSDIFDKPILNQCHHNVIKPCYELRNVGTESDIVELEVLILNDIVIIQYDMNKTNTALMLGLKYKLPYNNTFDTNCANITLSISSHDNTFGRNCSCIIGGEGIAFNTVGSNCSNIILYSYNENNVIKNNCSNIYLSIIAHDNIINDNSQNLIFYKEDDSENFNNFIGKSCQDILINGNNNIINNQCNGFILIGNYNHVLNFNGAVFDTSTNHGPLYNVMGNSDTVILYHCLNQDNELISWHPSDIAKNSQNMGWSAY